METRYYCQWCFIKLGSQEKHVVIDGKKYHTYCRRPAAIYYTLLPGDSGAQRLQHLQRPQDSRDFPPHLGAG